MVTLVDWFIQSFVDTFTHSFIIHSFSMRKRWSKKLWLMLNGSASGKKKDVFEKREEKKLIQVS